MKRDGNLSVFRTCEYGVRVLPPLRAVHIPLTVYLLWPSIWHKYYQKVRVASCGVLSTHVIAIRIRTSSWNIPELAALTSHCPPVANPQLDISTHPQPYFSLTTASTIKYRQNDPEMRAQRMWEDVYRPGRGVHVSPWTAGVSWGVEGCVYFYIPPSMSFS